MRKYEVTPDKYYSQDSVVNILNSVDAEYFRELQKPRQGKAKTWQFRRILVYTSFLTGLRAIELTRIQIRDIDIQGKQLIVHCAKKKQAKDQIIWLEDRLIPVLRLYIKNLPDNYYLLGNETQVSTSCLQRAFKQCVRLCSSGETMRSLHSTRHSYGTYYWNKTKDALATKWQMRLESLAMVSVYCQPTPEAMAEYAGKDCYQKKPTNCNNKAFNVVEYTPAILTA